MLILTFHVLKSKMFINLYNRQTETCRRFQKLRIHVVIFPRQPLEGSHALPQRKSASLVTFWLLLSLSMIVFSHIGYSCVQDVFDLFACSDTHTTCPVTILDHNASFVIRVLVN